MNRLNRIFHNKQIKLFWFASNFVRYAIPRRLLQGKLSKRLAEVEKCSDRDYIMDRVDYYCKLAGELKISDTLPTTLAEHKLGGGKRIRTAYFFDSYEFTRWFDNNLHWNMIPGDVTHIPDIPSIIKSRPVGGDNANSVVLNLDKFRHFVFLRDNIPFRQKEDRAIFRGAINSHHPNHHKRKRFMEMYFGSKVCDAGISNRHRTLPEEWTVPHITMYDHLRYRYIITIEGKIFDHLNAKKNHQKDAQMKAVSAKPAAPAAKPAAAPAPVVEQGIPGEIVAVIAAAIAAMGDGKYVLRAVRRADRKNGAWSRAGVNDVTSPF